MIMEEHLPFYSYSEYLQKKYGIKVYRIAVDGGFSCPNRGCGRAGGGCIYCSEQGSRASYLDKAKAIEEQIKRGIAFTKRRYKAEEFLLYFQTYSNTFDTVENLKKTYDAALALHPFRELIVATRPDCIDEETLDFLKAYDVRAIELGAQSMDDEVLLLNRRGHTAEDVIKASELIKAKGFELGLQMMTGLYGDTDEKAILTAKRLASLKPATVRIYPTVVLKGTELDRLYKSGEFNPQSVEEASELCVKLIPIFENAGIKIIRLGLHASEGVEGEMSAGAYHPAFKELCLGKIYLNNALKALENRQKGAVTLAVGERYVSQMAGQKKINISALKEMGYDVKIKADSSLKEYEVKVINE